ncbi:cytochrome P450 [Streptomyces sp. ISID311]|uniref:cytochrome P450 family protein n=1 Tax=Streptomyces sp. ISID311 TaxID=2601673 RepID=UPI00164AC9FE|nr:cytochrome P450 [Streptomyces sp. ISID311]
MNQYLDPYPYFGRLRALGRAVKIRTAFAGEGWLITHHRDAQALASDPRLRVDPRHAGPTLRKRLDEFRFLWTDGMAPHVQIADPPDHTRLRRLISRVFTPRRIDSLAPQVGDLVHTFLESAPRGAPFDLISGLAEPLPSLVICRLLGMKDEDALFLRPLINALTELPVDTESMHRIEQARRAAWQYTKGVVLEKRRQPGSDLLSSLITARDDDRLSEDELISMTVMLFAAGAETTTNVIGSGVLLLLRHPEQHDELMRRPDLIPSAVEEFLRYESPITLGLIRYAADDVEVGDTIIPRGDLVFLGVATANHDEERFPEAGRFDVSRGDNQHMAFGHGPHYCLGAPLARLELRIVIAELLTRYPGMRLACPVEDIVWRASVLRGPAALPIHLE